MIVKYLSPLFNSFTTNQKQHVSGWIYAEMDDSLYYGTIKSYFDRNEMFEVDAYLENPSKIVSKLHFRNLFTIEEKVSMLVENLPKTLAKEENLELAISTVKVIMDDFQNAETINLEDSRTILALQYLMSVRIITEDRLIRQGLIPPKKNYKKRRAR